MSAAPLRRGKLSPALLRELLAPATPGPKELLVPPGIGEDACVLKVPSGALIAASDPITLTGRGVGALAVIINANDVAVTGARPRWFLATVLLPTTTDEAAVRELFADMQRELGRLGAALVGGHTEVTDAVVQPVVAGHMLGFREDGGYVSTGGASPGDVVLQIGPAPIEGAAVLASEARDALAGVDPAVIARARAALEEPGIGVVTPALRCTELGATAMHDPTEGGLSAGLYELAEASAVRLEAIDPEAVLWFEPGRVLCAALAADPWGTLASGALLAAFSERDALSALAELRTEGFDVAQVAVAAPGEGVWLESGNALPRFDRDELSRVL